MIIKFYLQNCPNIFSNPSLSLIKLKSPPPPSLLSLLQFKPKPNSKSLLQWNPQTLGFSSTNLCGQFHLSVCSPHHWELFSNASWAQSYSSTHYSLMKYSSRTRSNDTARHNRDHRWWQWQQVIGFVIVILVYAILAIDLWVPNSFAPPAMAPSSPMRFYDFLLETFWFVVWLCSLVNEKGEENCFILLELCFLFNENYVFWLMR